MPSISAYFSESEIAIVKRAIGETKEKPAEYVSNAIRERMRREGHMPGTPAHDVRSEAVATCNVVGPEATLQALRALRAEQTQTGGGAAAAA
jgi:hypothetical protein